MYLTDKCFNYSLCGMLIWTLIRPGQFETHNNFFRTPGIEQTFVDRTTLSEPSHYADWADDALKINRGRLRIIP